MVYLYRDGVVLAEQPSGPSGLFSFSNVNLDIGENVFQAVSKDSQNKFSVFSEKLTIAYDTRIPGVIVKKDGNPVPEKNIFFNSNNSIDLEGNTSIIENIDYSDSADFRIEVDLPQQRLIVFYSDEILKEFICSGGTPGDDTPLGEFTTIEKIEYSWIDRYNVGAYYWVRFYGNYLIHSVPFDENGEMIVEEFEKLGNPASHGCIRLRLEEARWLYETLPLGVKVVIY